MPEEILDRRGYPVAIGMKSTLLAAAAVLLPPLCSVRAQGFSPAAPDAFGDLVGEVSTRLKDGFQAVKDGKEKEIRAAAPADTEGWPAYVRRLGAEIKAGFYPAGKNTVEFLVDGQQVKARGLDDVRKAKKFVDIEVYLWQPDEDGRRFVDILSAKVAQGLTVRTLLDADGSFGENPDERERAAALRAQMVRGGIRLRLTPSSFGVIHRNHRKLMVLDGPDGAIAYTGGMNIGNDYQEKWHDQQSRIQGPAVAILHEFFVADWNGGQPPQEMSWHQQQIPVGAAEPPGGVDTYVIAHKGGGADQNIKKAYLLGLDTAQKSICIENPYVTDPDFFEHLRVAAQRIKALTKGQGKVQLITPRDNDSPMTENKTRAQYPALKQAGVEVYEWPGMTHMKVAAMDGEWATFGSSNLDPFSTDKNDELNVIVMDKDFANEVAARICGADVPRSARK